MAGVGRSWTKPLTAAVLLLGAATVIFTHAAQAQSAPSGPAGSLRGRLTDLYSKPLDGLTVVARNQATGAEARTTTTKNGVYRFSGLEPGEYTLVAESRSEEHTSELQSRQYL